jgi:lipopolysaccharide export system protein LptC
MPKADIGIDDGTWFAVIANDGIYNQKIQTLELAGDVNLFHDSGYEFNTAKVTIDLVKGVAISDVVINGHGPFGNVTAEGFLIGKENNQFLFTGKSKLVVKLGISKNINQK